MALPSLPSIVDADMDADGEDRDGMGSLPVIQGAGSPPDHGISHHNPPASMSGPVRFSPRMQQSVNSLESASQSVCLTLAIKEQSDKSTTETYGRHMKHYIVWWGLFQSEVVKADPTKASIPALPITAAKATMFLDYTSTRPKVLLSFLNVPQFHFAYICLTAKTRQL
jgi:hypothetical protein